MGSTRLPGKVLADICGESMLARTVRRAARSRTLDTVVVATTVKPPDDRVVEEAGRLGVACIRGSEDDVLDRYVQAARLVEADIVVRITADCPLIDPEVIDSAVQAFIQAPPPDYCSNTLRRTYPRGLDTEVIARPALERAWREAREPHQREHVTPYFYEHPDLFRLRSVEAESDFSALRWTVDTEEDLAFVRAVYESFLPSRHFGWRDVLGLLDRKPELMLINQSVTQRSFQEG